MDAVTKEATEETHLCFNNHCFYHNRCSKVQHSVRIPYVSTL